MEKEAALKAQKGFFERLLAGLHTGSSKESLAIVSRLIWESGCRGLYGRDESYDSLRYVIQGTRFVSSQVRKDYQGGFSVPSTLSHLERLFHRDPTALADARANFAIGGGIHDRAFLEALALTLEDIVTLLPVAKDRATLPGDWGNVAARSREVQERRNPTVEGYAELPYAWEELEAIAQEISQATEPMRIRRLLIEKGLMAADGMLAKVMKRVTLDDGSEGIVRLLGYAHDKLAGGERRLAGLTFGFATPVASECMNDDRTNEGGWEASELRRWLNETFPERLPSDLAACIKPVCKLTNNKGFTISYLDVTETEDALWLFSRIELAGFWNAQMLWPEAPETYLYDLIANEEGSRYQLFTQLGVDDPYGVRDPTFSRQRPIVAYDRSFEPVRYWLRSPDPDVNSRFGVVETNGRIENGFSATGQYAVIPGFCI